VQPCELSGSKIRWLLSGSWTCALRNAIRNRGVAMGLLSTPLVVWFALKCAEAHFFPLSRRIQPETGFVDPLHSSYFWLSAMLESPWVGRIVPWVRVGLQTRPLAVVLACLYVTPLVICFGTSRVLGAAGEVLSARQRTLVLARLLITGMGVVLTGAALVGCASQTDPLTGRLGPALIPLELAAAYAMCGCIWLCAQGQLVALVWSYGATYALILVASLSARCFAPTGFFRLMGLSAGGSRGEAVALCTVYSAVFCASTVLGAYVLSRYQERAPEAE